MSNNSKTVAVSPAQAMGPMSNELRNTIYSALLSGTGIPNITAVLEHEMAAGGWMANLEAYMTHLLRTGECTTAAELNERVLVKVRQDMRSTLDLAGDDEPAANGVNGVNGVNGHKDGMTDGDFDLSIPQKVMTEGVKVTRRELDKVVEFVHDEDK